MRWKLTKLAGSGGKCSIKNLSAKNFKEFVSLDLCQALTVKPIQFERFSLFFLFVLMQETSINDRRIMKDKLLFWSVQLPHKVPSKIMNYWSHDTPEICLMLTAQR